MIQKQRHHLCEEPMNNFKIRGYIKNHPQIKQTAAKPKIYKTFTLQNTDQHIQYEFLIYVSEPSVFQQQYTKGDYVEIEGYIASYSGTITLNATIIKQKANKNRQQLMTKLNAYKQSDQQSQKSAVAHIQTESNDPSK